MRKIKKVNPKIILVIGGVILVLAAAGIIKNKSNSQKVVMHTDQGEKVVVENKNPQEECAKGSFIESPQGRFEITGKEKYSFDGEEKEVCCGIGEDNQSGSKTKFCWGLGENQDYSVLLKASGSPEKYQKQMENFSRNGKNCSRIYNEEGEVVINTCQ